MEFLYPPKINNGFDSIAYTQEQIKKTMKILQSLLGEDDIIQELVIKTASQKAHDVKELTIQKRDTSFTELNYDYNLHIPNARVERQFKD